MEYYEIVKNRLPINGVNIAYQNLWQSDLFDSSYKSDDIVYKGSKKSLFVFPNWWLYHQKLNTDSIRYPIINKVIGGFPIFLILSFCKAGFSCKNIIFLFSGEYRCINHWYNHHQLQKDVQGRTYHILERSPTVSPVTATLWTKEPFSPKCLGSIYFLVFSENKIILSKLGT